MFTESPQIINDATIGQVVVVSTPAASPQPSSLPSSQLLVKNYKPATLSIYGYGPKNGTVTLKGFGVSEETTIDDYGYFKFGSIYSLTKNYPELCLQAKDLENRTTQPTCIPSIPIERVIPLEIGPILLSPTISLSHNKVTENDEAYIEGATSPNIEVNVFISKSNKKRLALINEVQAYSFPVLKIKSDSYGKFSLSLPTNEKNDYKIYVSGNYGKDLSAKSNTLSFFVLGSAKSTISNISESILRNKITILILFELMIAVFLFFYALKLTTKSHKHREKDFLERLKLLG